MLKNGTAAVMLTSCASRWNVNVTLLRTLSPVVFVNPMSIYLRFSAVREKAYEPHFPSGSKVSFTGLLVHAVDRKTFL
jgi:hypothetical protein